MYGNNRYMHLIWILPVVFVMEKFPIGKAILLVIFGFLLLYFVLTYLDYKKGLADAKRKEDGNKSSNESTTFNEHGYDKNGFDRNNFDKYGYDRQGFDKNGYSRNGFDRKGMDKDGFDRDGYNQKGFNRDGFDRDGYNQKGFNRDGYDRDGYDHHGFNKEGFDRDGFDRNGLSKDGQKKAFCQLASSLFQTSNAPRGDNHVWRYGDDLLGLRFYLYGHTKSEFEKACKLADIELGSMKMKIGNYQYFFERKGAANYSKQSMHIANFCIENLNQREILELCDIYLDALKQRMHNRVFNINK